jgi:hypothetical protein
MILGIGEFYLGEFDNKGSGRVLILGNKNGKI